MNIGEKITYRGKEYEVKEAINNRHKCHGCFAAMATLGVCMDLPPCTASTTKDKKDHIYVAT